MRPPMYAASALIDAPLDDVARILARRLGGVPQERVWVVQGGWWYRGEWTVEPAPGGTRLTHRVRNIASTGTRWAVPLANRFFIGYRAATAKAFAEGVADIGRELDCATRLDD